MTTPTERPRPDLSPSTARSLRALLDRRRMTWRETLEGSAMGAVAGLGSALALIRLARRRRS